MSSLIQTLLKDVTSFFSNFSNEEHTPAQVKQEIEMHLAEKENIENSIPSYVVIGPFWVACEQVRQMLSKKRKTLANSVLEVLAKNLRNQADLVCDEFKTVARKLYDNPNGVEELTEQREYMKTLPAILIDKQELINKAMLDYELIEEFYYSISVDDFNAKWSCIGWPGKIEQQIEATTLALEKDEDRFHKNLLAEQNTFQDRLDGINMVVAGFSTYTDINKYVLKLLKRFKQKNKCK